MLMQSCRDGLIVEPIHIDHARFWRCIVGIEVKDRWPGRLPPIEVKRRRVSERLEALPMIETIGISDLTCGDVHLKLKIVLCEDWTFNLLRPGRKDEPARIASLYDANPACMYSEQAKARLFSIFHSV